MSTFTTDTGRPVPSATAAQMREIDRIRSLWCPSLGANEQRMWLVTALAAQLHGTQAGNTKAPRPEGLRGALAHPGEKGRGEQRAPALIEFGKDPRHVSAPR